MKKLFLLGNPRSGTSLFRLMLNAHSSIVSPPECGFLHWWYAKYKNWSANNINKNDVGNFVKDLLSSKKIETWSLASNEIENFLLEERPEDYESLTQAVYSYWAKRDGKDVKAIVDKNNYYIHHLEDLSTIWPDAKYLFLVRDGRDVACSYIDMQNLQTDSPYKPKLPSDIVEIAKEWNENNLKIERYLQSLGSNRWQLVKYEDLISNTEQTLKAVCSFVGVEFSNQMLYYYESNKERQDEPLSTLDWKKKTLEKPDIQNIGKYKTILSVLDYTSFNENALESLVKFRYPI